MQPNGQGLFIARVVFFPERPEVWVRVENMMYFPVCFFSLVFVTMDL